MVQVLPAKKTFLGELGAGMGAALPGAVQQYQENQQNKQRLHQQNESLKKAGFGDLIGLPPEVQKAAITERLKGEEKRKTKKEGAERLSGLLEKSHAQGSQLRGEKEDEGEYQPRYSDEFLAQLAQEEPAAARELSHAQDVERRESTEKIKIKQKENIERRKETLPLRKEYADKSKFAQQAIENKKGQKAILKTGNVNDPAYVELTKYLPGALGNRLLSPETHLYRAGLFDEFGVLRTFFPGATRVKEIELLEDKLATLDKSHEAKEEILDTGIMKAERDIILAKTARKYEKENPNATLLEFEEAVQERAQPELNKLFDRLMDRYEDIYIKHAPKISSYVDQHGKQYKNVPKNELKQLMKEAKESGLELKVKK